METKTKWKTDDQFTSGEKESQTRGHWKIPFTLLLLLQPRLEPVSQTGGCEMVFSNRWKKDLWFDKSLPNTDRKDGGLVSSKIQIVPCRSTGYWVPDSFKNSPILLYDHFSQLPWFSSVLSVHSQTPGSSGGYFITLYISKYRYVRI